MKHCILSSLALIFAACQGSPSGVAPLQEEDFSRAYAEVLLTGADPQNLEAAPDSIRPAIDSTLAQLGIRRSDFEASIENCNSDIRRWAPVLERVVDILNRKQLKTPTGQRNTGAVKSPPPQK